MLGDAIVTDLPLIFLATLKISYWWYHRWNEVDENVFFPVLMERKSDKAACLCNRLKFVTLLLNSLRVIGRLEA